MAPPNGWPPERDDAIRGRARAAEMNSDLAESVVTAALIRNVVALG